MFLEGMLDSIIIIIIIIIINIQWCISQTQKKTYYVYYCIRTTCFDSYGIIRRPFQDTDPYLAMFKMCCGIPNAYILDIAMFNPLTPNDLYSGRTAPLTSKPYILYIYSTNISTEYFKHGIYPPFFLFKMQFVSYF